MSLNHRLNAVCDQFTTGQRVFHADMSHGNAIINPNGIKFKWDTPCCTNGFFDKFTKSLQVYMSGHNIDIRVADGNKRFLKIVFTNYTGRTQQSPMWSSLKTKLDLI